MDRRARTLSDRPFPHGGGFVRSVELDTTMPSVGYPYELSVVAAVRAAGRWDLNPAVTFLIGDNGCGKSTLVEAIAAAAGFNPEGGSTSFRFTTRATESTLGEHLRLVRGTRRPRTGFFLRAESFYNVATEIENLEQVDPGLIASSYGGRSPHERSHGESFLVLAMHRFGPQGLYLLDEPESALSVHGCLALLRRMVDLVEAGSQFLVATHSPILLAYPGATIWQIDIEAGLRQVAYDDADPVRLHRGFLADPGRYLHHLLQDEPD
jgi:predicted ATPase